MSETFSVVCFFSSLFNACRKRSGQTDFSLATFNVGGISVLQLRRRRIRKNCRCRNLSVKLCMIQEIACQDISSTVETKHRASCQQRSCHVFRWHPCMATRQAAVKSVVPFLRQNVSTNFFFGGGGGTPYQCRRQKFLFCKFISDMRQIWGNVKFLESREGLRLPHNWNR